MHKMIYYCKEYKKTGKPIVVYDCDTKRTYNTNSYKITGDMKVSMVFNNSPTAIRRRGATTVLEVWK